MHLLFKIGRFNVECKTVAIFGDVLTVDCIVRLCSVSYNVTFILRCCNYSVREIRIGIYTSGFATVKNFKFRRKIVFKIRMFNGTYMVCTNVSKYGNV